MQKSKDSLMARFENVNINVYRSYELYATPVSFLAKEFDVRSVLHGQVSLAAFNQIYVFHEAMNGCKNLKIH